MDEIVYSSDKPNSCSLCYFWKNSEVGCKLGEENCHYIIVEEEKELTECDGCPYGNGRACVGWCTKKLLKDFGLYPEK